MVIKNGDLLKQENCLIIQQVNCMGVMGLGLAKQIKDKHPSVYYLYREYLNKCKLKNKNPLGSITINDLGNKHLVNFFSQYNYSKTKRVTDYQAFESCLLLLKEQLIKNKIESPIYFPYKIGCGFGGGNWGIISELIEKHIPNAIILKKE